MQHLPCLIFQTLKRFPIGSRNGSSSNNIVIRSRTSPRIFNLEPVRLPLGVFRGIESHSLDDVLVCSKTRQRTIPVRSRFRLAVVLAKVVLLLRKTPWLHQRWSSKDVEFHGPIPGDHFYNPSELFIRSQPQTCKSAWIGQTHSPLFLLGMILLELAFSAPLRMLGVGEDGMRCYSPWERDYLTFTRLRENVSRGLGSRYAKVVHRCLSEVQTPQQLHNPEPVEIQPEIYHDVASELEGCLFEITNE